MKNEYSIILLTSLFLSFALTFFTERYLITFLKKRAAQPIYESGPSWHIKKSGTPTMGGVAFLAPIVFCLIISLAFNCLYPHNYSCVSLIISCLFIIGNSLIGFFDDLTKLIRQDNGGFSPLQKLILQLLLTVVFLIARSRFLGANTEVRLFGGSINLGFFYYPISIFLILGIVNCANLTDGIDGLASVTALTVGLSFLCLSAVGLLDSGVISIISVGISTAFLFFNMHPAKIFMGDTGSLLLGAMAVCSAYSLNNPLILIPICSVYVIEGFSVVMQVIFFKATGRRIFIMSPIHHHLEKCGMSENKICIIAILLSLLVSAVTLLL